MSSGKWCPFCLGLNVLIFAALLSLLPHMLISQTPCVYGTPASNFPPQTVSLWPILYTNTSVYTHICTSVDIIQDMGIDSHSFMIGTRNMYLGYG